MVRSFTGDSSTSLGFPVPVLIRPLVCTLFGSANIHGPHQALPQLLDGDMLGREAHRAPALLPIKVCAEDKANSSAPDCVIRWEGTPAKTEGEPQAAEREQGELPRKETGHGFDALVLALSGPAVSKPSDGTVQDTVDPASSCIGARPAPSASKYSWTPRETSIFCRAGGDKQGEMMLPSRTGSRSDGRTPSGCAQGPVGRLASSWPRCGHVRSSTSPPGRVCRLEGPRLLHP